MSSNTTAETHPRVVAAVLACIITLVAVAMVMPVPAAAQDNTSDPYYNNTTATVDNESWMAGHENATLDNQVSMLTRISVVVVGSGPTTQGGGGPAGVLIFGFVLVGAGVATMGRSNVGAVGGGALFVALAAGVVQLGFAPAWTWALILLGVGIVATTAYLRSV